MESDKKNDGQTGGININGGQVNVHGDIVGRDKITKITIEASAPAVPALHQLPAPPPDFTGRGQELTELLAAVERSGATISGLQGLGGVGKTALALKLAERLMPRYPDAQFYRDLKGVTDKPLTSAEAMAHVIRAYHPTAKLPEDEAELGGLYRSVLHNQKALLLMDNAKDAQQVEPMLPPPGCLLLVTSRQHFAVPGLLPKNLDTLPPADASALLVRIAGRLKQEKNEVTARLVQLCGRLPLALRTVGSALAVRVDLDPMAYARKLADARERLKLTATEASLGLSYELLGAELQQRFCALAVFADTWAVTGAAAVWKMEEEPAREALGQLLHYSVVEFGAGRYRLHDLVRLFADARLGGTDRRVAQERHAAHYLTVAGAADDLYLQGGESLKNGLALFEVEWRNIQGGQAWAAAQAEENELAAKLCSKYPDAGAYCLSLRQHSREQVRWLDAALGAARRLKDRNSEGMHLGNLGVAYFNLGDTRRAIQYHEQALAIHREIGDRRNEGTGLGHLGNAYLNLGETRRAIQYFEQQLEIERDIGDRLGEGNSLGSLGVAYAQLGETRRAIGYYEQQLQIVREIGDRRGEGNALGNLGNVYVLLGEPRRAIGYYEQQLQIVREIGDRRGEGNALWNMALALDKLSERGQAIVRAEAALNVLEEIESPHAAKVRQRLAAWRTEQQS
jgi:tetratricopeptide (TPR) repeat protein